MNSRTNKDTSEVPATAAQIVREYGPFAGADSIHGVTYDGRRVWAATGSKLIAFDPESGTPMHTLEHPCDAGTAFDANTSIRSPRRASTRSIPLPVTCSHRFQRPGTAATRD
jgi:hypothetical protein